MGTSKRNGYDKAAHVISRNRIGIPHGNGNGVLEMYLAALPEVVKNAAAPLAQTEKIVMYGDGNSTKLVKDVMTSADQIMAGVKESTGIDVTSLISGFVAGKVAANTEDNQN